MISSQKILKSTTILQGGLIDYFKVVGLLSYRLSEHEAEVDLVLIQTSVLLLWKLCLKYQSEQNNFIYTIKQEGLYQNKVISSLVSICNCKKKFMVARAYLYACSLCF